VVLGNKIHVLVLALLAAQQEADSGPNARKHVVLCQRSGR
jgi:hypothetical protein